jgi:outer membrane protein OmpA-like peptidoglycan-associated protein
MVGEESQLRADASDPDGDALEYRWSAPAGEFQGGVNRSTQQWQAPSDATRVPVTVTVEDGYGGTASDTITIDVTEPPPPPAREYVFEDVHFDFDRYTLRVEASRVLDEVVSAMQDDPNLRIQIDGHTCNIGTAEYNLALSERRSNSVEEYLTSRGISSSRLQTQSYGEERPQHDNTREETRRLNRRAALTVTLQ